MVQETEKPRPELARKKEGAGENRESSPGDRERAAAEEQEARQVLEEHKAELEKADEGAKKEATKEVEAELKEELTEGDFDAMKAELDPQPIKADEDDPELAEYERLRNRSALTKIRDWIFKTKSGRASLAAFGAFRIFTALGGQEWAAERGQDLMGSNEAQQEMRLSIQEMPEFKLEMAREGSGAETEPDPETGQMLDALVTEAVQEISRNNNGATFRQIAETTSRGTMEIDGVEQEVLDAEKVYHFYGDQLRGGYINLGADVFQDGLEEATGRSRTETNTIGGIVTDTLVMNPGGAGFVGVQYQGQAEFAGKVSGEEMRHMYDQVYDNQMELLHTMYTAVDYENLEGEEQEAAFKYMSAAATELKELSLSSYELGFEIAGLQVGSDSTSQYEQEMSEFKGIMYEFDAFADSVNEEPREGEFIDVGNELAGQMNDRIAGLYEQQAEAVGSLGGAEELREKAAVYRGDTGDTGDSGMQMVQN